MIRMKITNDESWEIGTERTILRLSFKLFNLIEDPSFPI